MTSDDPEPLSMHQKWHCIILRGLVEAERHSGYSPSALIPSKLDNVLTHEALS